jgi:hypothetical protein
MQISEVMTVLRKYFPNCTVSEMGDGEIVLNTGFSESSKWEEIPVDNHVVEISKG